MRTIAEDAPPDDKSYLDPARACPIDTVAADPAGTRKQATLEGDGRAFEQITAELKLFDSRKRENAETTICTN